MRAYKKVTLMLHEGHGPPAKWRCSASAGATVPQVLITREGG